MSDLLQLQEISKSFDLSGPPAVNRASFSCLRGQNVAILGSSGSGKTTLLRIIAGLEMPDSGQINLANQTINSPDKFTPPEKRDCTLVFQNYALFPNMTVRQNISFGKSANKNLVDDLLELTKINELQNRYPHEISGGEQQRVALVRALVTQPSLLLLDEPLSHLDPELRDDVRRELINIFRKTGTTSLFVSHDTEDALTMADKIVIMQRGKTTQIGTPMELYTKPESRYVALLFGKTNFVPRNLIPSTENYFFDSKTKSEVISIRPHQWKVVNSNNNNDRVTFSGEVSNYTQKGTHSEIQLKTQNMDIQLNIPITETVKLGDNLTIIYQEDPSTN